MQSYLYGVIRVTRDDLQRRFLGQQCWKNVVTIRNNVATMLQRCVALKIAVSCNITLLRTAMYKRFINSIIIIIISGKSLSSPTGVEPTTLLYVTGPDPLPLSYKRFVGAKAVKLSSHSICTSSILHLVHPKHFA